MTDPCLMAGTDSRLEVERAVLQLEVGRAPLLWKRAGLYLVIEKDPLYWKCRRVGLYLEEEMGLLC